MILDLCTMFWVSIRCDKIFFCFCKDVEISSESGDSESGSLESPAHASPKPQNPEVTDADSAAADSKDYDIIKELNVDDLELDQELNTKDENVPGRRRPSALFF